MNYYDSVYRKRLNRYGRDFQSRLQNQREHDFEEKLLKSVYRVDFTYEEKIHPATLEPYKQDETQLIQRLLTRIDLKLPGGTILMIPDKDKIEQPWMVYWLESIKASGYNRYIVLKMTHFLTWQDENDQERTSWAYMRGKQDGILKDMLQGKDSVYSENDTPSFFIMPRNQYIKKDTYIEMGEEAFKEAYKVTGYDFQSTEGVEFVTVDSVFLRDHSPIPQPKTGEDKDEFFWLNGGDN